MFSKILLAGLATLVTLSANASLYADMNCGNGDFVISRSTPQDVYAFHFYLSGHALEHFKKNGTLDNLAIANNRFVAYHPGYYKRDETPLAVELRNGNVLTLIKDKSSSGYILRDGDETEYYFSNCEFGVSFRSR